jgi:hypothetical protein
MIPNNLTSHPASLHHWVHASTSKLRSWADDFQDWRVNADKQAAIRPEPACDEAEERQERITDTRIAIGALAAAVPIGLWLGRDPGHILPNPVWQVIFGLCALAAAGLYVRLARLKREEHSR